MTSMADRVLARFKEADEHNPDPLTFKAFLSEFKQGEQRGEQMTLTPDAPVPVMNDLVAIEEKISGAARDLLELARRIEAITGRGSLGVNEHRLAAKMSGILSTLFYNAGVAKGIKSNRTV